MQVVMGNVLPSSKCHGVNKSIKTYIYMYNSVLTRRHRHSNSSASTPPNATKIAEMKVSQPGLVIVGPELLFSNFKCFFFSLFARGSDAKRMRAERTLPQSTDLQDGGGAT